MHTIAVARALGDEQKRLSKAKDCFAAANKYFKEQLVLLDPQLKIFKAARLFSPRHIASGPCNPRLVEDLRAVSFFESAAIDKLTQEFPEYHTLAEGCASGTNLLAWWPRAAGRIPTWSWACKIMMLCQPSSGAAERVFAVLRDSIGKHQQSALEDYQAVSVMLASRVDREEVKDM